MNPSRRSFIFGAGPAIVIGNAIAINDPNLALCNQCEREIPEHLAYFKSINCPNEGWWKHAFPSNPDVICLKCADHRICYPYFERIYWATEGILPPKIFDPNIAPGLQQATFLEKCGSEFYEKLWSEPHECSCDLGLFELEEFFAERKKGD